MLLNRNDLQVGDEFLIASGGNFVHYKVLSLPKKPGSSTFRCSTRKNLVSSTYSNHTYEYYVRQFTTNSEEHNERESVNLAGKSIWLLKREI